MNRSFFMHWIKNNDDFFKINDMNYVKEVKWSKKYSEDLINLSKEYFNSAYIIATEISSDKYNSNVKFDMWSLPSFYLFRQSIELLLKGGIAINENHNPTLQDIFLISKHNLYTLYIELNKYTNKYNLSIIENEWLLKYLADIEYIDSSSDLFRYPFSKELLLNYGDKYLNVYDMWNRLVQCYSLLNKKIYGIYYLDNDFNSNEEPLFFSLAKHGIGYCSLWEPSFSDGFHKHIVGYSEVGDFLFKNIEKSDFHCIYPLVFLYRNAIELTLKRLLLSQTEICVNERKIITIKNSHNLKKDLWRNIKPMLSYYGAIQNFDLTQLEIAETYIESLNGIDKNSDTFRYPFTKSFEYKFNNKELDIENVHSYLKSIFNFLDGCGSMMNDISEYENDMRNYNY